MRLRGLRAAMLCGPLALGGCGGGGGGVSFIPPAPVTPAPTPTPLPSPAPVTPAPTPTPLPSPAPSSELSFVDIFTPPPKDGPVATIGLEAKGDGTPSLTSTGFSVSYDALLDRYLVKVPSMQSGYFYRRGPGNVDVDPDWIIGALGSQDRTGEHGHLQVLKPSNTQLKLSYTTMAGYNLYDGNLPFGWFAFGTATPAGAVPVNGSASYSALIRGSMVAGLGQVTGTAALQFDFGVGKLSGHLDPVLNDPTGLGYSPIALGPYAFVNTVYSTGSTSFSGQLSNANVTGLGSFSGVFTGPSAQELMATWSAPFEFPDTKDSGQIFGALVGAKQ